MKHIIRLAACLCLAICGQLHAQNGLDFHLGGPDETIQDEFIFASGGVTVKANAWSISRTAQDAVFESSEVVRWSPGIGVKNSSEYISTVPYVPYYVDNEDHYDFVLFVFSEKVDVSSVNVSPSAGTFDLDVSYWFGNVDPGLGLAGETFAGLSSLGFGARVDNDWYVSPSARTFGVSAPTGGINAMLVGARVGGDQDFDRFKISSLQGATVIPEPGSIGLLGIGLYGLLLRRRRH